MNALPLDPLTQVPSQYWDQRKTPHGAYEGERRLWLAVAEMALKDWAFATQDGHAPVMSGWDGRNRALKRARVFAELSEWLDRQDDAPGSLRMLCEAFDMDFATVRARLLAGELVRMPRAECRGAHLINRGKYRVRA